jgi:flagellar basal body-associated protein FliL
MWLNLIIGALFIVLGLVVHVGKMYFLISGYNTMRKEKKANVDIRRLARLVGIYSYINGGVFLLMGILQAAGLKLSMMPAFIFLMISSFVLTLMSKRYDYNLVDQHGRLRKGAGKKIIIPIGILVVTFAFVAVLMFFSAQDTEVSFLDEGLEIHGMYGDVYAWETIRGVELMESLPTIELRTNGSALGSTLKGNFRTTEFGAVKLFVDADVPPFIYFEAGNTRIIFNLADEDETKAAYEELKTQLQL